MEQIRNILVVSYSQSGQLDEITDNFIQPLENVEIDRINYSPKSPFPFPWTTESFFDAMPESVLEKPVEMNQISYKYTKYDLIIFAYQPWYLSPSIPASSLLQDTEFLRRVNGTPVITLIGSRNMWLNSQESIKARIKKAGGTIIANIPFADRNQNQISAVTILHWMLTGRKTKKFNILPRPGVNDNDILAASDLGRILDKAIQNNDTSNLQNEFLSTGFMILPTEIMFIEKKAKRLFLIWSKIISKHGTTLVRRKRLILAYKYYLFIALFLAAPLIMVLYKIFIVPFKRKSINKEKQVYLRQIDSKCLYL
jgi:hypothetical protein